MLFGGFRGIDAYDLNEAKIDEKLFQTKIYSKIPPQNQHKQIKITYFYEKEPVTIIKEEFFQHQSDESYDVTSLADFNFKSSQKPTEPSFSKASILLEKTKLNHLHDLNNSGSLNKSFTRSEVTKETNKFANKLLKR